jgi:PBP1b-binding outer membrane lipoprotein LpoB
MKTTKYITLLIVYLLINGCAVNNVSKSRTTRVLEVEHKPIIADLEVTDKKITGTANGKASDNIEDLKKTAIAVALNSVGADVLIQPDFETQSDGYKTTVTVTGRTAIYKNFRPMTEADIPLINAGVSAQVSKFSSSVTPDSKPSKNGTAKVIAIIAMVTSVLLVIISIAQ